MTVPHKVKKNGDIEFENADDAETWMLEFIENVKKTSGVSKQ